MRGCSRPRLCCRLGSVHSDSEHVDRDAQPLAHAQQSGVLSGAPAARFWFETTTVRGLQLRVTSLLAMSMPGADALACLVL